MANSDPVTYDSIDKVLQERQDSGPPWALEECKELWKYLGVLGANFDRITELDAEGKKLLGTRAYEILARRASYLRSAYYKTHQSELGMPSRCITISLYRNDKKKYQGLEPVICRDWTETCQQNCACGMTFNLEREEMMQRLRAKVKNTKSLVLFNKALLELLFPSDQARFISVKKLCSGNKCLWCGKSYAKQGGLLYKLVLEMICISDSFANIINKVTLEKIGVRIDVVVGSIIRHI